MIMGHIGFGTDFDYFIHAFHMPMFFFISGYLYGIKYSEKADMKFKYFLAKKIKTLIIPYLFFGIFHYIYYVVSNNSYSFEPIYHLFWDNSGGLPVAGALWFLTALFFADILYFSISKYIKNIKIKTVLIVFIAIFGNVSAKLLDFRLPFSIDAAMVGVGLFHIGYCLKKYDCKKEINKVLNLSIREIILFSIFISEMIFYNSRIDMWASKYGNILLFWINAVGASIILMNICKKMCFESIILNFLKFIGKNSIIYVCLNQRVIESLSRIKMLKISVYMYCQLLGTLKLTAVLTYLCAVKLMLTLILLCIISIVITKTALRVVIGRKI